MRSQGWNSKLYQGSNAGGHFFIFLAVGVGPGRQVGQRRVLLRRGEPGLLVQSNKLVGITRAAEPAGGGAGVHHHSSSPPISRALSRAESSTHTYTCVRVYIFHVGWIYSEKFAAASLASAAVVPRVFQTSRNPPLNARDPRWFAKYWENLLDWRINEKRRYEF